MKDARQALGRASARGRGPALHPPARARRRRHGRRGRSPRARSSSASFDWSPDGTRIAFDHRVSSDAGDGGSADISIVDVATGARTPLVTQAGPDSNPRWSPDGRQHRLRVGDGQAVLLLREQRRSPWSTPGTTGVSSLTDAFDEDPSLVDWTPSAASSFPRRSARRSGLFTLDPSTRAVRRDPSTEPWIGRLAVLVRRPTARGWRSSATARRSSPTCSPVRSARIRSARRVSDTRAQVAAWPTHPARWSAGRARTAPRSRACCTSPPSFQAGRRYPLLVVIHGGPDRHVAADAVHQLRRLLPDRRVPGPGRAGARAELPRQRRLRREVPRPQRPQPRHRRRLGRALRHRPPGRAGTGRSRPRRRHGLEPGRLHLGVPHHAACRSLQGDLGGRRHLGLDDLLRQHRHPPVHAAVPEGDAVGRSEDLRRHLADDLHQAGEDADADPARRPGPAGADAERLPALSGPARSERAGPPRRSSRASATG